MASGSVARGQREQRHTRIFTEKLRGKTMIRDLFNTPLRQSRSANKRCYLFGDAHPNLLPRTGLRLYNN